MKQDVLNYESGINRGEYESVPMFEKRERFSSRYTPWGLQDTITQFISKGQSNIQWIGNDEHANILSFFYAVLIGCLNDNSRNNESFLKLKYCLYQQSKQTLSKGEQKIFVEHLGLLEYSKDVGEFLKKSSHLESIFMKMFLMRKKENKKKNLHVQNGAQVHNKIFQLHWYSLIFPFLNFQIINEHCGKMLINNKIFFIVEEKQCFFVIENGQSTAFSPQPKSIPASVRPAAHPNLSKIRSMEFLSNLHAHSQTPAEQKERESPTFRYYMKEKKKIHGHQNQKEEGPEIQESQEEKKKGFNIMDCIKEIEQTIDDEISGQNQKIIDSRRYFINNSTESLRNSLGRNKQSTQPLKRYVEIMVSPPKVQTSQSEAETVCNEQKNHGYWREKKKSRSKSKKRNDFFHQSLGAKEAAIGHKIFQDELESNKKTPKFLSKKNTEGQSVHVTPSKSSLKPGTEKQIQDSKNSKKEHYIPTLKPLDRFANNPHLSNQASPRPEERRPIYLPLKNQHKEGKFFKKL